MYKMMKISCITLVLVLVVCVNYSLQWTGVVCSSRYCAGYRYERRCAYRTWSACCYWRWYRVPVWRTRYFCCAGWTTSSERNCDKPICNPPCVNGQCVSPNQCRCNDGAIGATCNTLTCNYERPCFPGTCTSAGPSVSCTCTSGFATPGGNQVDFCRQLTSDQTPIIWEATARMSFWPRGTGQPTMEKYALYVDSTNSSEVDFVWTNRRRFNWLNVTASAQYEIDGLPVQPVYIKRYGLGIAQAEAHLLLQKVPYRGSSLTTISLDMTLPCSPEVSHLNPTSDTYTCNISKPDFDRLLENGDKLTITFKAYSGGFRELQRIYPSIQDRGTQNYTGPEATEAMEYRFDFLKPEHECLRENATCQTDTSFYMTSDITKTPIRLHWSRWDDIPSGMFRYAWEVFRLEVDGNNVLREPKPLEPIHGPVEVNQSSSSSNSFEVNYTPPQPGVYSFILEASDRANNSIFVRRICLYDPSSSVTIDSTKDRRLFISSANPNGDYNWQLDPNQDIEVKWTNHFVNLVHEEGKWLNKVKDYPPELEDFLKNIPRSSNQDDHQGQRTVDEIPNRRGIVKFEIAKAKDSNGGQGQSIPTSGWIDVGLNETFTINAGSMGGQLTSSDTVTVWVRATDVLGNTRIDSTHVSFDDSPPEADTNPTFLRDQPSHNVHYGSTVRLNLLDMQSGLKRVNLEVIKAGTSEIVSNHTMLLSSIPKSACEGRVGECYCPKALTPLCYDTTQEIAINNCWMLVPELEDAPSVNVGMAFMNMAGLVTSRSIRIDNLKTLKGTQSFLGPMNLRASDVTETTATVSWNHSASCYERTEMWINYRENGELKMIQLHHSATSYNLANLQAGTGYIIELISQYGDIKSTPVTLNLVTTSTGLSVGAIAGIVVGVLLLLVIILVIVGLILFKLGMLGAIMKREKTYRQPATVEAPTPTGKQDHRTSRWAFENTTYQKDEEIYIYGSMDLGEPWYVPHDDITLMEEIAKGRFARVYKARWRETPKNVREVAAKVLLEHNSEDNIMLMLAKINFAATQVGEHRNIIGFLGAVMDNDALGPVMVLEYCECGQLDKWLVKKRSSVSEDVLDRIQTFGLEIARAMEYLASKGIVHRKLAARNCLLTFLLEIKVTGFGPCRNDESADDTKGDRIPIKWTAPECLTSLKQANEKSDSWSYGITLWEIFSMGETPYSNIRGRDLPTKVKGGYRMSRPEYAEDMHYQLVQDCWADSPSQRPDFKNIVHTLESSFGLRPGDDQNYYYQR